MLTRDLGQIIHRQRPATLPESASVQEACRLMRKRRIGAVLVIGEEGQLSGIFTGRDAVGRVLAEALDPVTTPLSAVMTRNPDTLRPGHSAVEALRMMHDGGYRHVPVIDEDLICGIVSHGDFKALEHERHEGERHVWEVI